MEFITGICRKSRAYRNGEQKIITGQLGCSFDYDAAKEDGWMLGDGAGFSGALPVDKSLELVPRPNQKLILEDRAASVPFRTLPGRYLFDLGREEVGFLELDLDSDRDQPILIAYGEHLTEDGEVAVCSDEPRCLILHTALLAPKTTRTSQGVAVMTLKKNRRLTEAKFLAETAIQNPARYRVRSLPAAGALLKGEDNGEKQLTLEV